MKIRLRCLLILYICLFQISCYAKDKHHLTLDRNKLYIDNEYCLTKGNNKVDVIKYFGQPDCIDEVFNGYVYFYNNYNLCFEIDFDNNVSYFFYYFLNYPFESINFNVEKFTIDELDYIRDSDLTTIRKVLDENNIRYELKDCKTYMELAVFYNLNGETKKYYCRFTKDQVLERIQY